MNYYSALIRKEILTCSTTWMNLKDKKKWCVHSQSCPTLYDPVDCSLTGSSVYGIFQTRILECVAISSSRSEISQSQKDKCCVIPLT